MAVLTLLVGAITLALWLATYFHFQRLLDLLSTVNIQNVRTVAREMKRAGWILGVVSVANILLAIGGFICVAVNSDRIHGDQWVVLILAWACGIGIVAFPQCVVLSVVCFIQANRIRARIRFNQTDYREFPVAADKTRDRLLVGQLVWLILIALALPGVLLFLVVLMISWVPLSTVAGKARRATQLLVVLTLGVKFNRNLPNSVRAFAESWRPRHQARLMRLAIALESGQSLGEALATVPSLFPKWIISQIIVAERSGNLLPALEELSRQYIGDMNGQRNRPSLVGWMGYGVLCCLTGISVVGFLMMYIVPKYKVIFRDFNSALPDPFNSLVRTADAFANFWFLAFPVIALIGYGLVELMRAEASNWKSLSYRFLHPLWLRLDAPDILRQLAYCFESNRPVVDCLAVLGDSHFRPSIREALDEVHARLVNGGDCFTELRQWGFVSANDLKLINAAQKAGNLPWSLRELAQLSERRLAFRAQVMAEFLRPVPILIGGAIVLWIAIAFFLPITRLIENWA